jgi:peptide/nickel transport system substrate-binding protein
MKNIKLLATILALTTVLLLIISCVQAPVPAQPPAEAEQAPPAEVQVEEPAQAETEETAPVEAETSETEAVAEAGEPGAGGTLILATSIDVPSLEPHLESADAWHRRKALIYENLTWVDNDVVVQPQLAESWDISEDGLVYTFHLRQGVKFHNGQEMTAEDVKYSLERQLNPDVGSAGRGDLTMIQGIEVVDPYTLNITLVEPTGPFLTALGGRYNAIIPKDSAPDGDTLRRQAIGTGPYMVAEFVPTERLVLQKNPDYWQESTPLLDEIVIQVIPDEQTILAGLRAGTIDMAVLEDANSYMLLEGDENIILERTPAIKIDTLELPPDVEPLDDVRVRQAILLALDKEAIMEAGIQGLGRVVGGMPPAMTYWSLPPEELPNQQRDVEKARQLLAEAGYPDGFELPIRTIVGYATMAADAPVIAANLKEVGIDVSIDTVDLGVWIEDWRGLREPPTRNAWGGFMDPDLLYYRHFHTPPKGMDFRRWNNPTADELLDKGRSTIDPAERKAYYDELQRLMAEEAPMIPLYSPDLLVARQPYVQGYIQHPSGWYYGLAQTWLEK